MLTRLSSLYSHNFHKLSIRTHRSEYFGANLALFAIPFLVSQPQLLTGTLVNLGLIYIALNFKKNELLPAILLPSLAAFLHGVIWGPLSPYLAVMMPLIWLGNASLVMAVRFFALRKANSFIMVASAALLKAGILFGGTFVLVHTLNFPQALLGAMGITQLITALAGGVLYLVLNRVRKGTVSTSHKN